MAADFIAIICLHEFPAALQCEEGTTILSSISMSSEKPLYNSATTGSWWSHRIQYPDGEGHDHGGFIWGFVVIAVILCRASETILLYANGSLQRYTINRIGA